MTKFMQDAGTNVNDQLINEMGRIRAQMENLHIPPGVYSDIRFINGACQVVESGGEFGIVKRQVSRKDAENIYGWLERHAQEENLKYIAAAVNAQDLLGKEYSKMWLDYDIVPFVFSSDDMSHYIEDHTLARYVDDQFDEEHVAKINISNDRSVLVSDIVQLKDYEDITGDSVMDEIKELAEKFKGKKALFVNATPQGGGVSIMRHALLRFFKLIDVDCSWHVLTEHAEGFRVTKTKFHNILQGVAGKDLRLTDYDKDIYTTWIEENAEIMHEPLMRADVIVIDDPQPTGLIPLIREKRPDVLILYRSHIQLDTKAMAKKGSPANEVWQFLWKNIEMTDLFISQPIEEFIPHTIDKDEVHMMPPTTDPLDGLNKPLTSRDIDYYMRLFNFKLLEEGQAPLDPDRSYMVQIARFDPSKGFPDVIDAYYRLREKMKDMPKKDIPELVIVGHGSVDDPDGKLVRRLLEKMLHTDKYKKYASDIKRALLPHVDQLFNAILRESSVCLQLSHKEGFEFKVSEALVKGKPVVVYNAGGIPLQVEDGETGFILETGDVSGVSEKLYELFTDSKLYERMSKAANKAEHVGMYTTGNARNWLQLFNEVTS